MERTYIFQKLLFGVALLGLLGLVFPQLALPHANAAAAQTLPAISMNTSGARDARTFENDKALDAACRKSGQDQAICLCVTHVMKYEMSLKTYRAATRLYGRPADRTALHRKLETEGYKASEITVAEDMERSLTTSQDFAPRCAEAKAYYRTSKR